jgi:hypothetical protein
MKPVWALCTLFIGGSFFEMSSGFIHGNLKITGYMSTSDN